MLGLLLEEKPHQNANERERNAGAAVEHDGGNAPRRRAPRSVALLSSAHTSRVVHQAGGNGIDGEYHARGAVVLRVRLLAVDPNGVRLSPG